jgi:anaerobic magnesium-protoporphyrin IX monomethyl ester cyclase
MKTVLINLPSPWLISDRDVPPMGILSIAAALRDWGDEVTLCDLAGLPEEHWYIPDGDFFGISTTTPQYPYALKVIKKLRERQKCLIAIGGIHPTVLPERTKQETGADWVVVGEGERVVRDIVGGHRDGGIIVADQIENVNVISWPAVDMLDTYDYFSIGTNSYVSGAKREAYIQTARGCPYACAFCCQAQMWRGKVRERAISKVMREARHYIERYGVDQIYFFDDILPLNPKRMKEFCGEAEKLGVAWHCMSRVDCVDRDMLAMMCRAGCRAVTFGIESGSPRMLTRMGKRFGTAESKVAIETSKDVGLKVRCQMIVGFPGETEETVQETVDFVKAAPADRWGFHAFVPFPGCDVWDHPEKYDFKLNKEAVDFGKMHTIGKPCEFDADNKVKGWLDFLIREASGKNIFNADAKLK